MRAGRWRRTRTRARIRDRGPVLERVERRGTAAELRARLGEPKATAGAPAPPFTQRQGPIDELEELQPPEYPRRIEQIAGEHGDHALLEFQRIARVAEHVAHNRLVEAINEE